jgi:ubiquinone/menaquinone biosynthesis C-methylase UbiE
MDDKLFWEKYFLTYDILNEAIPYQKLMDDLIGALEVKSGDLILDAGSGTGNLCIRLKEYGAKPIGFDLSDKALEIHRQKDKDAEVYLGDLCEELPFPDNYFDKIVSNNVLYTIDKNVRIDVIKNLFRVLKSGGLFVIANVHTGFKPIIILRDHFNQSKSRKGLLKTVIDINSKILPIARMIYYGGLLVAKHNTGKYAFLRQNEHNYLLEQAGFRNDIKTILTYSTQSYLDRGIKI